MQIVNVSDDARELPAINRIIEAGEMFDVPDDLAASLLEQPANWAVPSTVKE